MISDNLNVPLAGTSQRFTAFHARHRGVGERDTRGDRRRGAFGPNVDGPSPRAGVAVAGQPRTRGGARGLVPCALVPKNPWQGRLRQTDPGAGGIAGRTHPRVPEGAAVPCAGCVPMVQRRRGGNAPALTRSRLRSAPGEGSLRRPGGPPGGRPRTARGTARSRKSRWASW